MNSGIKPPNTNLSSILGSILLGVGIVGVLVIVLFLFLLLQMPDFSQPAGFLDGLFALNSQQVFWYITRAAGMTAYLILWFSVAWGLAVPSKILDNLLHRTFTYDFHEFVSLLALGFTLVHMVVLMFDRYLPYNILQILIPFLSPYRPLWVGIGVIGFYLMVLVTITFYTRSRIGMKTFRAIHLFSFLAYLGATLHGFFSGTDTPLVSVMLMYVITFTITVLLTLYWLVVLVINQRRRNSQARASPVTPVRPQTVSYPQNYSNRPRRR